MTLQKLSLFIPFGRFTNAKIRPNTKHAYLTSIFVYICLFLRNFSTWRALILFSDVTAVGAQGCQGSLQLRRRRRQRARRSARAFAHCSCVLSTHSQETLTSVYADLKGGAGQRGGCNRGSRSERTPPNTSSSFCVASFSSLENREELLLRLSLFTSTAVMSVYDKCWLKG